MNEEDIGRVPSAPGSREPSREGVSAAVAASIPSRESDLSLCPFCGDRDSGGPTVDDFGEYAVWCDHCHAHGPPRKTEADAIRAWNLRAVADERES